MKVIKLLSFCLFFALLPTSCDITENIESELTVLREQAVAALNNGINALQNESTDWKSVLKDLETKIDKRVQDVLTYNIPYITNLASQRALSSVLCVKESVKDEVVYYLQVVRAELVTGKLPPLPHTKICATSLLTLDLNAPRSIRNQIIYTGYYLHTKDSLHAVLVNDSVQLEIPKSKLGFPDISNFTLSLTDYSDALLSNFTHLQLMYNKDVISSIAIDKKLPEPPVIEIASTQIRNIIWIPPHTNGNKDFDGDGPRMISHVYLKQDGRKVYASVYLYAQETKSDWTTAMGTSNWIEIYTVKDGYRINKIKDPTDYLNILKVNNLDYVDNSVEDYTMETVVGRAIVVGDTEGDEAGSRTKISLNLKSFDVEIQKIQ
ncbi:MAG: hypothetical protein JNL70_14210 [Saprospiraceae bacterium]|nr:hypothetical protein [Saprospiraceae bacterium]